MTKNITLGDFTYHIYVEEEEGYFWGCWRNLSNDDKGSSSKACSSKDEALSAAECNARMDFGFKHKGRGNGAS